MKNLVLISGFVLFCLTFSNISFAQTAEYKFINGDALPDAPELAQRGEFKVGVRTIEVTNKEQTDILKSKAGDILYNRNLKLEIWYPAIFPEGTNDVIFYNEERGVANDPQKKLIKYNFTGRAVRDAVPVINKGAFPLIIVSHGYVGSRLLMTYLTENLASKGFVVVAIDHMESTYTDAGGFQSTLLNRSRDILYVLDQMAELSKPGGSSFLAGLADAENTGLVGYSMGGYGVLNAAGAGYSTQLLKMFGALTGGSTAIEVLIAENPGYKSMYDKRIKAIVAFAPWGMERGAWDAEGLKSLKVPAFFVAGSQDDVSGYEKGTKAIFSGTINSDRYLLTYFNARHNVAPNAPPEESLNPGLPFDFYYHYAEPAWDQKRLNNINQHFVTAFFGIYLKNSDYRKYLDFDRNIKVWPGFKPRTFVGLELLHEVSSAE
jgi:predicted dienelactone hydrolase